MTCETEITGEAAILPGIFSTCLVKESSAPPGYPSTNLPKKMPRRNRERGVGAVPRLASPASCRQSNAAWPRAPVAASHYAQSPSRPSCLASPPHMSQPSSSASSMPRQYRLPVPVNTYTRRFATAVCDHLAKVLTACPGPTGTRACSLTTQEQTTFLRCLLYSSRRSVYHSR